MSPYKKKQKEKRRKNLFRKWHRRIGFTAALFLVNLAITGILLNHSDDLELHKQYIESDWLVNLYGIKAPEQAICIKEASITKKTCQLGDIIFLDNTILIENSSPLVGLVELDELYYLATEQKIFIYTMGFELVEILDKETKLPSPIASISLSDSEQYKTQSIVILSDQKRWRLDQDELIWGKTETLVKQTSSLLVIQDGTFMELKNIYLDNQITQLKFIQDLHSGRVVSLPGKILTDLVGIIILLLAISGFIAWQKRKVK